MYINISYGELSLSLDKRHLPSMQPVPEQRRKEREKNNNNQVAFSKSLLQKGCEEGEYS